MEHPIIFREKSVRAILDGKKTQTRRVIKNIGKYTEFLTFENNIIGVQEMLNRYINLSKTGTFKTFCPYGKIGDLLWVRESLRRYSRLNFLESKFFNPDFEEVPKEYQKWTAQYTATGTAVPYAPGAKEGWCGTALWQWKNKTLSPIFMPRWASRITLEITNVRAEHLQDITDEDAMAEGVLEWYYETQYDENSFSYWSPVHGSGARNKFSEMWNSVNAKTKYSWENNSWVWVVEFKKI